MNSLARVELPLSLTRRAEILVDEVLAIAYHDKIEPKGIRDFLGLQKKPGKICCIFYSGRSGSFFAQSFFDSYDHPQVLTIHPAALAAYEDVVTEDFLHEYNCGMNRTASAIEEWSAALLTHFPILYTETPGQPGLAPLCVPKEIFTKLIGAQLLLLDHGGLTQEILLKILIIAYRLSRGGRLDCTKPLTYMWQAHVPSARRKQWIKETFKEHLLLTVVRFPEKSLDSHLVHHAFETLSPPSSTLVRRLLFQHMAQDSELLTIPPDGTEYAVRFEDLHHHTAYVLRAICAWLDVPFHAELCESSYSMHVLDRKVSGARKLTAEEFQCKILNHFDRLKVRFLLQEEYRTWGYGAYCEGGLDASLKAYQKDRVAQTCPFGAQALLTQLNGSDDGWFSADPGKQDLQIPGKRTLHGENKKLEGMFRAQRERRDHGIHVTPLLYAFENLPTV